MGKEIPNSSIWFYNNVENKKWWWRADAIWISNNVIYVWMGKVGKKPVLWPYIDIGIAGGGKKLSKDTLSLER